MVVITDAEQEQNSEAVQTVLKSLDDPRTAGLILEEQANALKSILGDASVLKLVRAHDKLEEGRKQVETQDTVKLSREVGTDLEPQVASDDSAAELSGLLQDPHFVSLLEVHDAVAFKTYADKPPPASPGLNDESGTLNGFGGQPIRMVGLHKQPNKPLGMTLAVENQELVVARIIHGGMIDRQGLLHVGDKIKEVNGRDMSGNPKELQDLLRESTGKIFLKVIPSNLEAPSLSQVFLRAFFDYDPAKDNMIPCQDAGLSFKKGDVLQIVEQDDPNWWQAKRTDGSDEAGIIPSQICEEMRRSFVKKERPRSGILCGGKKKQKVMYKSAKNADFDRHEMTVYEEVARMPPFRRKTLVLVGAQGVGRRTLKNRMILSDRSRFGTTIPHTSRQPRGGEENGKGYHFTSREEMDADIKAGQYLEHGDFEGNLYGTKVDSIRDIMRSGKMCILDVNPTALKILKTPEFMPYVVFIASPPLDTLREIHKRATSEGTITKKQTDEDLQKTVEESEKLYTSYSHYFDCVITNENSDDALKALKCHIDGLSTEPQWVPVSWVY